jgi:hypothetical protein
VTGPFLGTAPVASVEGWGAVLFAAALGARRNATKTA